jgi:hypothetical protein
LLIQKREEKKKEKQKKKINKRKKETNFVTSGDFLTFRSRQ